MVMEYLEGCTLGDLIQAQAPLPPNRVAHIGAQIADALAAAHGAGIIHRDVKPANVFLIKRKSTDDYVKLLDFGIARLHPDCGGLEATQSGQIVGTPIYMPPEQAKGNPVSASADIYSLGIMLYEMLSGDFPFPRTSAVQMMMAHISEPPKVLHVPDLPRGFKALVESCLAKDAKDRPPNAQVISEKLEAWAEETKRPTSVHLAERPESEPTPPDAYVETWDSSSPPEPTAGKKHRGKVLLVAVATVALALTVWWQQSSGSSAGSAPKASTPSALESTRALMDSQYLALGIPPSPEDCRVRELEPLKTHLQVAQLLEGGKPGGARPQDRQAIKRIAQLSGDLSPETLFWKARSHLLAGELAPAIKNAQLAHQYCDTFAAAYALEGTAKAMQDNHPEAIKSLEMAISLQSDYIDARFNLALSQISIQQTAAAVANLSIVLSLDPEAHTARYLRGESFIELGDLPRARKDLELSVEEFHANGAAWYALSYARYHTGDLQGARRAGCTAEELGHPRAVCTPADAPDPEDWVFDDP